MPNEPQIIMIPTAYTELLVCHNYVFLKQLSQYKSDIQESDTNNSQKDIMIQARVALSQFDFMLAEWLYA